MAHVPIRISGLPAEFCGGAAARAGRVQREGGGPRVTADMVAVLGATITRGTGAGVGMNRQLHF